SHVNYMELRDHRVAIAKVLELLADKEVGVLGSINELDAVGHRVVHGGEDFAASVVINSEVKEAIHKNSALAPLHNPPNLLGIEAVEAALPELPQVAVFDTACHQTMPKKAYLYGLPKAQYEIHKIRRYGFHGTSHKYVAEQTIATLGKPAAETKIITCHLGNGGSLTAFDGGKSVDTTMGMTPLEGILMGTRSGTMDPYIPLHLIQSQGLSVSEVNGIMNKEGGLLGLCGRSDMRDLLKAREEGCEDAIVAFDAFVYRIQKFVGSYVAAMNGVDAIVFTAGIGENNALIRKAVMDNFKFLGVEINDAANDANEVEISTADSKVKVYVIPTNEELVIAQDTAALIG
ncbi:acetate/propionate family kinase, partial [Verrucomicrobiota bacterium]